MEKLKNNYTIRLRFRKIIVLVEAVGFALYLAGFTTPYWVLFLSKNSMLTSTRGLFATCVTTAGKPTCANIKHFSETLIIADVFGCISGVLYIIALIAGLLVINWLEEQRRRVLVLSIVSNIITGSTIIVTVLTYYMYTQEIEGTPVSVFYIVVASSVLIIITGIVWILDYNLKEPHKLQKILSFPPISLINHRPVTAVRKVRIIREPTLAW